MSTRDIIAKLKYTAKLQEAILPKNRHFSRLFEDHFVLYRPLEYLSGDFYWIAEKDNKKYIAVADCTGHGISAAFLGMIGYNFLNYAVLNKGLTETNDILKELDKKIIETFTSIDEDPFNNDWMDISLVAFDKKNNKLQYSGANRKIIMIDRDQTIQLNGSRYPIGGWQLESNRDFEAMEIVVNSPKVYLGSDGFQDQFSEHSSKKFTSKKLHSMIQKFSPYNMTTQKILLEKELDDWKGNEAQTDDICLIGVHLQ